MKKEDIDSIIDGPYETADAVIVGAPCEQTASGHGGMGKGPEAVANILREDIELYDRFLGTEPAYQHQFSFKLLDDARSATPEDMVNIIKNALHNEQRFYVLIGGVHSVSIGSLQALSERVDPSTVTIVHIDAHYDLRDDDSEYSDTPSKFAHSAAMRRGHELGFKLLPIGIRTIFREEAAYAKEHNIKTFQWGRQHMLAPDHAALPSIEEVLAEITTDTVYLSIDVDGFDPSVMPGTGTPVPGGLSFEYGHALIRAIMREKNVIAADVVEIAPEKDSYITEYNAAQLIYEMLALHMAKATNSL